jgi:hypothetical protein
MKQTYYELDCTAFMCFFQIKINDVEVFSLNVDGQTTADIPINHGILESEIQEIEVRVLPLSGTKALHKNAYVRYKLVEFDVSSGKFELINQLENHQTPPVVEGIPFTISKSKFQSNVTYKLAAWQNSLNLKDLKINIKEKLIIEYNKIIHDLNSGNYQNFIEKCKKREKNVAFAMYLNESEAKNRLSKLTNDFKSGFKAKPISKDVIVEYSALGKLACLKSLNGLSALHLENSKTDEELLLPITFHIPEGKTEFEVI